MGLHREKNISDEEERACNEKTFFCRCFDDDHWCF